jgi:UPF0755 protein
MKKIILYLALALVLVGAVSAWLVAGPATAFDTPTYQLEIPTGSQYKDVLQQLESTSVIKHPGVFNWLAQRFDYPEKLKAGRYILHRGSSLVSILRKLRNGQQDPVNLVITKLRTLEDLAAMAGRKLEFDSASFMQYLLNNDTLVKYGLDTNTVMVAVLPDTYTYFWNTTPSKVMGKMFRAYEAFWTEARRSKAQAKGLSPQQATILASIIEEETNNNDEKGTIASVYLNRLGKGMKLGADPTVKFALRDFGLRRIYQKHLAVESPYNTYRVAGLPPGPICTPQRVTIDAVLDAPQTDYLYFVARADFSGHHAFAATYEEHLKNAKAYQQALDKLQESKKANEETGVQK